MGKGVRDGGSDRNNESERNHRGGLESPRPLWDVVPASWLKESKDGQRDPEPHAGIVGRQGYLGGDEAVDDPAVGQVLGERLVVVPDVEQYQLGDVQNHGDGVANGHQSQNQVAGTPQLFRVQNENTDDVGEDSNHTNNQACVAMESGVSVSDVQEPGLFPN